jgi:hypothetical protein
VLFWTLDPGSGSGIEKNPETGSGIRDPGTGLNIPDLIFENLVKVFFGVKKKFTFFDAIADADPGSAILPTLDQGYGMKKIGSGFRDKHPRSATQIAQFFILHFCSSWKQLTSVHNWRSCTALVGHQVAILNLFIIYFIFLEACSTQFFLANHS